MNWIEQIVTALLKWATGLARQETTSIDAKPDPELRKSLLSKLPGSDPVGVRDDKGGVRYGGGPGSAG